jgi:hypothetical protein
MWGGITNAELTVGIILAVLGLLTVVLGTGWLILHLIEHVRLV